jgi:hypothetical protein
VWLDVPSGSEHESVDRVEDGGDRVRKLGEGQRQAAGGKHRALDADPAVVTEVVQARGDADQRRPRQIPAAPLEIA